MKRASNLTKAEIREAIAGIDSELAELERTHGANVDMRPWASNDHPVSLQHWALVQRRFRLKEEIRKPVLTCEQRAARSERMKSLRLDSRNTSARALFNTQIDDRLPDGPTAAPERLSTGTFAS
jgi:hypothetical protein